jgi:hypothetical protein
MDSAPGGCRRLLISLASPTQGGAPSFAFLWTGFEEVGRISNDKSALLRSTCGLLVNWA